jgi:LCP family protein required for cell wall assembly
VVDDASERHEHDQSADDAFPRRRDVHGRGDREEREGNPWRRRIAIGVAVVLVLVAGVSAVLFWKLNSNITKVDVSEALGTDRPTRAPEAMEATNILLVGSDTREGKGNDKIGMPVDDPGQHSDTNLLVHLSADRTWATVVSIPRDSMTPAPPECSATAPVDEWVMRQWNHNYKIGGIGCLIRTLEGNTDVYVDHYAVVDFRGFQSMVDALGGVKVCTEEPIDDVNAQLQLTAGTHVLDGKQALGYVRARKSLGDGSDLGRIKRQQAFLSSVAQEATSTKLLFEPTKLYSFLDAATQSLTTDPEFGLGTMKDLAESVRNIGLKNIDFITVPNEVYPADPNRVQWQQSADQIWESFREDRPVNEKPKPASSATPSATPSLTVSPRKIPVLVVNATGTPGLAGQAQNALEVQGFRSVQTSNASPGPEGALVEYSGDDDSAARTVAAAFPGAKVARTEGLGTTVRVTLGAGAPEVVEIPNRLGTTPVPSPTVHAPKPTPSPTATIETRKASESICSTS